MCCDPSKGYNTTAPLRMQSRSESGSTLDPIPSRAVMHLAAVYAVLPIIGSRAILVNRTIDDTYGDSVTGLGPSYSPPGSWALGPECVGCAVHAAQSPSVVGRGAEVDLAHTFLGTWHDCTSTLDVEHNITITFVGQAVHVFNILGNVVADMDATTNLFFTLDNVVVANFSHVPDPDGPELLYNVSVFSMSDLSQAPHTLVISTYGTSLVLFDYVVYTVDEPDSNHDPYGISQTATPSSSTLGTPSTSTRRLPLRPLPSHTSTNGSSSPPIGTPSLSPLILHNVTMTPSTTESLSQTAVSSPSLSPSSSPTPPSRPSGLSQSSAIGIAAGATFFGVLVLLLVAVFAVRRHNRRPACMSSDSLDMGSELHDDSAVSSPSIASAAAPPQARSPSSAGLSIVATHADSRGGRPGIDHSTAASSTILTADEHAARVRLFDKITAATRPSAADTQTRTRAARARSLPQSHPSMSARGIRVELAGLRAELEWLRREEPALARGAGRAGPACEPGQQDATMHQA
ncbi:hypothetical protein C8Q77DRAFT_114749 [Trametes polyzona]|nr:hypothetical protein C8Q77DRAFT_114749 [Trametes polyzona]